jgi:hypothetical protein
MHSPAKQVLIIRIQIRSEGVKGNPGTTNGISMVSTGGNYRPKSPGLKPARQGNKGIQVAKGPEGRQYDSSVMNTGSAHFLSLLKGFLSLISPDHREMSISIKRH